MQRTSPNYSRTTGLDHCGSAEDRSRSQCRGAGRPLVLGKHSARCGTASWGVICMLMTLALNSHLRRHAWRCEDRCLAVPARNRLIGSGVRSSSCGSRWQLTGPVQAKGGPVPDVCRRSSDRTPAGLGHPAWRGTGGRLHRSGRLRRWLYGFVLSWQIHRGVRCATWLQPRR